jgi:hypothetical protein
MRWPALARIQRAGQIFSLAHFPRRCFGAKACYKPSKGAVKAFKQGLRAWKKGQSDQALSYLAETVQLDPGYARVNLGALYAKMCRPEEALDRYERAAAGAEFGGCYTATKRRR